MSGFPAARLLMGRWFCCGVSVAADALGECILGVRRGLGIAQIKLSFATMLALAMTILMFLMLSGGVSRVLVGRSYGRHGTSSLRRANMATKTNQPETQSKKESTT
jgi:hypothetical protein